MLSHPDLTAAFNAGLSTGAVPPGALADRAEIGRRFGVYRNNVAYSLITAPQHGAITLHGDGTFSYTPTAGYYGADSFTYRASDGSLDSTVATVNVRVEGLLPPRVSIRGSDPQDGVA